MASLYYEGIGYEGGGFLRANVVFTTPKAKAGKPVDYKAPNDAEIAKREREAYRDNLPEWLCKFLGA